MKKFIMLLVLLILACSIFAIQAQAVSSNKPIIGMARTATGNGYWMVASDGGVFTYGDAKFYGSAGNIALNKPIVGMAARPQGDGYWLVASDGGIFTYGAAPFKGSTGGMVLNKPIVGMAATPSGNGYWLVASDGGIFTFGDAGFYGSAGNLRLNSPIVGMAARPQGDGYWLVASDGGIFSFGNAPFYGSAAGKTAVGVRGMTVNPQGNGYWLFGADGGVFTFGNAKFYGSAAGQTISPVVGMAASKSGSGYWLVNSYGRIFRYGDAPSCWYQKDEVTVDGYRVVAMVDISQDAYRWFINNHVHSYASGTNIDKPIYWMRAEASLWATLYGTRLEIIPNTAKDAYNVSRLLLRNPYGGEFLVSRNKPTNWTQYTDFAGYGYSRFKTSSASEIYQVTTLDRNPNGTSGLYSW